jgi:transposase
VESYLGLTPGEDSSGSRQRTTGITKAGSSALRRTLVQAAWSAMRTCTDPMVRWALEVMHRRGKRIAVIALARKMAGIMYALLRDGTKYNATRGAAM